MISAKRSNSVADINANEQYDVDAIGNLANLLSKRNVACRENVANKLILEILSKNNTRVSVREIGSGSFILFGVMQDVDNPFISITRFKTDEGAAALIEVIGKSKKHQETGQLTQKRLELRLICLDETLAIMHPIFKDGIFSIQAGS